MYFKINNKYRPCTIPGHPFHLFYLKTQLSSNGQKQVHFRPKRVLFRPPRRHVCAHGQHPAGKYLQRDTAANDPATVCPRDTRLATGRKRGVVGENNGER